MSISRKYTIWLLGWTSTVIVKTSMLNGEW